MELKYSKFLLLDLTGIGTKDYLRADEFEAVGVLKN